MKLWVWVVCACFSVTWGAALELPSFQSLKTALSTLIQKEKRPSWPPAYSVSWRFYIPYIDKLQEKSFEYRYTAIQDYKHGLQKVIRDDVETVIIDGNTKKMYEIFPKFDDFECWIESADKPDGPTRRRRLHMMPTGVLNSAQEYLAFILPDLTEPRWVHVGMVYFPVEGHEKTKVDEWKWDLTEEDMEMHYTFYTNAKDGSPVRLVMHGINLYTGGHKDEYIADFYDFKVLENIPEGTFQPPVDLKCTENGDSNRQHIHSLYHQLAPSKYWGHQMYDRFSHQYGRRHNTKEEYINRLEQYNGNRKYIDTWNAERKEGDHTLGPNHMMDWTDDEYRAFSLGRKASALSSSEKAKKMVKLTDFVSSSDFLPGEVIWKGSPADSPVKDQAACGSCYAFSAIAALESAFSRCKGGQTLLSEQRILDCAWSEKNTGCFGGEQVETFEYIFNGGGVSLLNDYPYRGINDFCQKEAKVIALKGDYKIVEWNEDAVKAALFKKGPLAVSVDADPSSFRFYTNGVYANPSCGTKAKDLSHAVILSGYGTDNVTGKDYWLVKNTWSTWWGEEGYIRIERHPNDCGISTEALYVEIDCDNLP